MPTCTRTIGVTGRWSEANVELAMEFQSRFPRDVHAGFWRDRRKAESRPRLGWGRYPSIMTARYTSGIRVSDLA